MQENRTAASAARAARRATRTSPPEPPTGPAGAQVRYGEGGRAKLICTSGHRWSDEAESLFFDALAASCNVKHAAAASGFTPPTVYAQRRKRPEFAARWDEALGQGYVRLEMALVEAAVDTFEGVPFDADRPIPPVTVAEAIRLVQLYRGAVKGDGPGPGRRPRRRTLDEVRASIIRKIEAIENAEAANEAGSDNVQTSGA